MILKKLLSEHAPDRLLYPGHVVSRIMPQNKKKLQAFCKKLLSSKFYDPSGSQSDANCQTPPRSTVEEDIAMQEYVVFVLRE